MARGSGDGIFGDAGTIDLSTARDVFQPLIRSARAKLFVFVSLFYWVQGSKKLPLIPSYRSERRNASLEMEDSPDRPDHVVNEHGLALAARYDRDQSRETLGVLNRSR